MSDGDVKGERCHARVDVVSFLCTRCDISTNSCEDFGALKTAACIYPLRHTFVIRENMSRRVVVSGKTFEPVFFIALSDDFQTAETGKLADACSGEKKATESVATEVELDAENNTFSYFQFSLMCLSMMEN